MKALDIGKFTQICLDIESEQDKQGNFGNALFVGELRKFISSFPPIEAVQFDMLCEWLGKFANPCKIGIRCYYPDDNNEDCMPTVECWRYVLTKWMEGQDAKEKRRNHPNQ